MSVTGWTETVPAKIKVNPQSGKATLTAVYFCDATADLVEVADYALDTLPATVAAPLGLTATLIDVDCTQEGPGESGVCKWNVTAVWEVPEYRADDGETPPDSVPWSFDTTGGSTHINASRSITGHYVASGVTEVTPGGTIGDDGKGQVNGCDIVAPACRFEVVNTYTLSAFSTSALMSAYRLTGKANSSSLTVTVGPGKSFTFATGEALFAGVRANYDPKSGNVQVYCTFLGSANASSITIGEVSGVDKPGHDFLEVKSEDKKDETSGKMVRTVSEVIIHRVYEFVNLNGICGL
jgi:hypothetical protein